MEASLLKNLSDKAYEKRRVAALEIERHVRDTLANKDHGRVVQTIGSLTELLHTSSNNNAKCGSLMGLAAVAIALGYANVPKYLNLLVNPILDAFSDKENSVRYFASESMYNCSKVARGEILIYFNEIFDTLSKLAADPDALIHNGAELLDRLIKDIVSDQAATYVSSLAAPLESTAADGEPVASGSSATDDGVSVSMPTAFSLERFIPLLEERIMTRNPKTRSFLVAWLGTLDSIPELELVTYLPNFLDGLLNFLKDEHTEVRTGTFNSLAEFLREIREIAEVQAEREEQRTRRRERLAEKRKQEPVDENAPSQNHPETPATIESASTVQASTSAEDSESESDEDASDDGAGLGSWMPGQGVLVRHAEIVEILITRMVDFEVDQSIQAVCLRWLREFLHFAEPTILSFVPKLAPIVLSALSHPIPSLRQLAETLNDDLYQVIQQLPSPSVQSGAPTTNQDQASPSTAPSPLPPQQQQTQTEKPNRIPHLIERVTKGPSPTPHHEAEQKDTSIDASDEDPLDFQATVTALAILLGAEEEESRLAALHWLSMLHLKAPNKVLSREDGTFPALLKTLSDTSEDVIRSDLQLLAQISSYGDEEYFNNFMLNLVRLFSTDRGLLEQRGRLIVGQLCTCLNAELIFRTLAKILEDEEDLEFASLMVQNLSLFLITLPELSEFRKRLRNVDQKDSQMLFTALYRSWSHNASATLALCFLAGAYEHASNLLSVFGELEMTVPLLVQIDKLVQILESTAFIPLRLQLLEPDRYPFLLKALYGILMLLPQSTAFVTLRNRLNSVTALSYLHAAPRPSPNAHTGPTSARSTLRRPDEIKWQEFLTHFRNTQLRHEKLRTVPAPAPPPFAVDMESASASGVHAGNGASTNANTKGGTSATTGAGGARPGLRRAFGAPPATASGSLAQQQSRAGSSKGGAGAAGGTTRSTTGSRGTSPRTSTAFPRKT